MATRINVIPASEFIVATGHGEVDFGGTRALFMKIMKAAALVPSAHVLVDVREATSQMAPFEVYSLVTVFSEMEPPFSGRLAIVNRPKHDFDRMVKTAASMLASRHICASLGIKAEEEKYRFGFAA